MSLDHCRRAGIVSMVGAALLATTAIAQAQPRQPTYDSRLALDQARKDITSVVEGSVRAAEAQDIGALDRFYTPDATIVDGSGQQSWAEYRDKSLRAQFQSLAAANHGAAISKIDIWDDTAVVTFDYAIAAKPESARAQLGDSPAVAAVITGAVGVVGKGTFVLRRINNEWRGVHVQTAGRAMRPGEREKFSHLFETRR
jgi:hypothetical protein